ncbi:hypothetical protein [Actinokineospora spheciospongiae]|uniref:hypothetical protein n=1 Tax=Actinokineospora spheciospongiae TaxID=909613 RepID=UPI0011B4DAC8|nr:hypothetical protein [Actinokineospora spheciospongiae]
MPDGERVVADEAGDRQFPGVSRGTGDRLELEDRAALRLGQDEAADVDRLTRAGRVRDAHDLEQRRGGVDQQGPRLDECSALCRAGQGHRAAERGEVLQRGGQVRHQVEVAEHDEVV